MRPIYCCMDPAEQNKTESYEYLPERLPAWSHPLMLCIHIKVTQAFGSK